MSLDYQSSFYPEYCPKIKNTEQKIEQALPDVQFSVKEIESVRRVFKEFLHDERDIYHLRSPTMA